MKDLLAGLRYSFATCEYETGTNARSCSILTPFFVGLHERRTRARLVIERDLTLDTVLLLAETYLRAEAESRQLNCPDKNVLHIERVKHPSSGQAKCFRCDNHDRMKSA